MLKPEAAKKQLEKWQIDPGGDDEPALDRFLPAVRKLPKQLQTIGYSLLDRDSRGKDAWDDWDKRTAFHRLQAHALEGLSSRDRLRVFRTLFGSLAGHVEIAWRWMESAPYSHGYTQTPFRAPNSPELTLEARGDWVRSLVRLAAAFQSDVLTPQWLAAWVPYIEIGWTDYEDEVGTLLAAVIDAGGKQADEVFDVLCRSARKEHEIGAMGRHVTRALLSASRPEGWELMERMLLAAQRQEGLRQVILQSVVVACPAAFQRMLRLIVEENLSRFSSVVQAADHWFGLAWAAAGGKKVNDTIHSVADLLDKPALRKEALASDDAERLYLALWATAFEDGPASIEPAERLLRHQSVEVRFVGALHLARLGLPGAQPARVKALDDEDLRVALCALQGPMHDEESESMELEGGAPLFEALERLLVRMPAKPTKLKPLVWPWTEQTARRGEVSNQLIASLGKLPPMRLIPHMKRYDTWGRVNLLEKLADEKTWDAQTRGTILDLAGDASADVRDRAFKALRKAKITPADAERLEGYLTRTVADLRNGVVSLVLSLRDKEALASAERLLESKNQNQRLAGLEILRQLAEADRQRSVCIDTAATWGAGRKKILKAEQSQLDAVLDSDRKTFTLDDALGLMDPAERSMAAPPKKRKVRSMTAAGSKILKSLDDLVHKNRQEEIRYKDWRGKDAEEPLGEIDYSFPSPNFQKTADGQLDRLPLREIWDEWYDKRPASLKDKDGLELLRANMFLLLTGDYGYGEFRDWVKGSAGRKAIATFLLGNLSAPKLKYETVVRDLVQWLLVIHPPKGAVDFLLDVTETVAAMIPEKDMQLIQRRPESKDDDFDPDESDWRNMEFFAIWSRFIWRFLTMPSLKPTRQQKTRYWRLLRWVEEPFEGAMRSRPDLEVVIDAYRDGIATLADVTDHLLGPDRRDRYGGVSFDSLKMTTVRQPGRGLRDFVARPEIVELLDFCRQRVLEIELARGEAATAATDAALSLGAYRGVDTLLKLLAALGKDGFKKLRGWRSEERDSRPATFTEMVGNTYPAEGDTPEQFTKAMRRAIQDGHFPDERLLQLAFLAPQWSDFVEAALKWDGFSEGLYWYMAHMRYVWGIEEAFEDDADVDENDVDDSDEEDEEDRPRKLSRWERIIRERTPLTAEERNDGAIDVAWFHRTYRQLTARRWEAMAAAAKSAASPGQAKRAQFIADVLLGKASKKDLVDGIRKKNLKENVRLLGLLPLADGARRGRDVADRYELLQEYRRYANKLSSMTKPDALRACDVGLKNLAATAGFADPMRLQWAMEAESTKDLAKGPVAVSKGDVSLTLSLDEHAQPEITIRRGDKTLKSLPKTVNKDKKFVELRERAALVKRQASRVKQSLETAMCRGDDFTGAELMQLADHAVLWPQLERLVLLGEGIAGYPAKRGKALQDHAGKLEPVKKKEQLRVAHPHDLLRSKAWDKWQHECFHAERLQPFKQVFRELYVVTRQEKKDRTFSNRYAGQQVNPRQAHALWGSRGWSVDEYENVWKAFHDEGLNASVSFDYGFTTPLEVEGLTIDKVQFRRRDEYEPLKLTDVPPRVFSEVMRDMDLVVSVAHAGDVDPEASASTVEMRASLLRETCRLLSLKNVKLKDSRALVKGRLGEYTVHLGSGVVHRMPGGSVCIVPVHSQHRGRLFLPFADDDPRTAEVISKTLLLARDDEIDDPIILEQLRAMA
ncbi:MAG: DUF5724 domain-containing protein [Planctomycetota bacterium]|jgi:hypothetical protein